MRKNLKKINLPLFWKFAISSTIVVLIFGTVNIYLLWDSVYKSFENEIDKRCRVLAKITAEKAITPMVYENDLSLYKVLENIKESDPGVSYIFILDTAGNLVSQTLNMSLPPKLISANQPANNGYNINVIKAKNYRHPVIRDIAYPIMNGKLGVVRLGIIEQNIQKELRKATTTLSFMILAFLVIGLLGTWVFSYLITSPIKKISDKAHSLDLDSIEMEDSISSRPKRLNFFGFKTKDELDILVDKFSEMVCRLKSNYLQLKNTQKALIQAEKMSSLGTLSAGVAHEVNNPISGIKNCIKRIKKRPDNISQNIQYIDLIEDATGKMESVVKNLLSFSRKQDFKLSKTSLNKVIENAVLLTSHKFKKHNITVHQLYSTEFFVNGSANHLEQVFVNLILNAIDAISERSVNDKNFQGKIEIKLEKKKNCNIVIYFKDNGIGIPETEKKNIFDPFFTLKEVGEGTGLGLSVTFSIIKKHNGNISVESKEDHFTEFLINLPCYKE